MESLSDDIVQHIFSFVPSGKELSTLSKTHRRAHQLVHHSHTDIFNNLWQSRYGDKNGGRRSFQSLYYFRQLLQLDLSNLASYPSRFCKFRKAGLLSDEQERAALLYESNVHSSCMGYFGMKQLWQGGPVAVWGDYQGVRLLSRGVEQLMEDEDRTAIFIGQDVSRVLSFFVLSEKKLMFLAFASGMVSCIHVKGSNKDDYTYETISSASAHNNEVTSLSIVSTKGNHSGLFSGSVDGKIFKYPRATEGSLEGATMICNLGSAVLTISALNHPGGRTFLLAGDSSAYITLYWGTQDCSNEWSKIDTKLRSKRNAVPTQSLLWSSGSNLYAICGDNSGGISFWEVNELLELEFIDWKDTRSMVESFEVSGNLLLVCGGSQVSCFILPGTGGHDLIWQGTINCYSQVTKSTILSSFLCHFRKSFVTFCRDGTLQEIKYSSQNLSAISAATTEKHASRVHHVKKKKTSTHESAKCNQLKKRSSSRKRKPSSKLLESVSTLPFYDLLPDATFPIVRNGANFRTSNESVTKKAKKSKTLIMSTEATVTLSLADIDKLMTTRKAKYANTMRMRIIQEAFQLHRKGTNNLLWDSRIFNVGIENAFERHSGIEPCEECKLSGFSNYTCRIKLGHTQNLSPEIFPEKLVARLSNQTMPSSLAYYEDDWICSRCFLTCSKERCGLCHGWKGGRRENFPRK